MKKILKLYFSPSKKWARILGDSMLIAAGVLGGITLIEPVLETKRVILFAILSIVGKILTNFTKKKEDGNIS